MDAKITTKRDSIGKSVESFNLEVLCAHQFLGKDVFD